MTEPSGSGPLRPLSAEEQALVDRARETCRVLYEGAVVPHRSCGIALAETFCLATSPYQSLRRGGITGRGECGTVVAGRLILGQLLGDPDPTGAVTPALAAAAETYEQLWRDRLDRGAAPGDSVVCNVLTGQFAEFRSAPRHAFCTMLATDVAGVVCEVLLRHGHVPDVAPLPSAE
ncbi:MAG: hypothetical protein H6742_10655 [Alphaproteobacteria bacterium]|nr:hypothetical protein [Alphaproteobacteria bacterium]